MAKTKIFILLFLQMFCAVNTANNQFDPSNSKNLFLFGLMADSTVRLEVSSNRVRPGGSIFVMSNADLSDVPGGFVLPVINAEDSPIKRIIPRSRFLYEVTFSPAVSEGTFIFNLKDHYETFSRAVTPENLEIEVDDAPPMFEVRGGNSLDISELRSGFVDLEANEEIEWDESNSNISLSGTAKNSLVVSSIIKSKKHLRILFSGVPNANGGILVISLYGVKDKAGNSETEIRIPIQVFAFRSGPLMLLPKRSCVGLELDDGRRIVLGGRSRGGSPEFVIDGNRTLSRMEIYDPLNRVFENGIDMLYRRQEFDAVKLRDGRVLVSGGFGGVRFHPDNLMLNSTEIFDPNTNTWSQGPNLHFARMQHKMTVLTNGDVLVVGGITPFSPFDSISSVERIHITPNVSDMTISLVGQMPESRGRQAQILTRNGKVVIFGGENLVSFSPFASGNFVSRALSSIVIFDEATNTLSSSSVQVHPRFNHFVKELENGEILIFGGMNHRTNIGQPELRAQIYNPFTDRIRTQGSIMYAREWGSSFEFPYGRDRFLVAGSIEYQTTGNGYFSASLDSETWSHSANRFYVTSQSLGTRWEACQIRYTSNGGGMILGGRLSEILRNTEEYSFE
ncbi:MAG: kelch-like protein [Leptospira sp.]|jgi:hypothetical protein|nr:kelch-like protein [Leptospira sp.]